VVNTNLVTLNLNPNGASILGSNTSSQTNSVDGNYDKTVSHFEVNKDSNKEAIFSKDLPVANLASIQNTFITSLKKRNVGNLRSNLYDNVSFRSVPDETSSIEKLDKYLNDPVILKMEKDLMENKMLDSIYASEGNTKIVPDFSFKQTGQVSAVKAVDVVHYKKSSLVICLFVFLTTTIFFFIQSSVILETYAEKLKLEKKSTPKDEITFEITEGVGGQNDKLKSRISLAFTLIKIILSISTFFLLHNVLNQFGITHCGVILTLTYIPVVVYLSYKVVLDMEGADICGILK
jgi:hypothetical protein